MSGHREVLHWLQFSSLRLPNPKNKIKLEHIHGPCQNRVTCGQTGFYLPAIESVASCCQFRFVIFLARSLSVRATSLCVPSIHNGFVSIDDPRPLQEP
jgi:hypothetical protein